MSAAPNGVVAPDRNVAVRAALTVAAHAPIRQNYQGQAQVVASGAGEEHKSAAAVGTRGYDCRIA